MQNQPSHVMKLTALPAVEQQHVSRDSLMQRRLHSVVHQQLLYGMSPAGQHCCRNACL
jgi:hypothetical protein